MPRVLFSTRKQPHSHKPHAPHLATSAYRLDYYPPAISLYIARRVDGLHTLFLVRDFFLSLTLSLSLYIYKIIIIILGYNTPVTAY